MVPTASSNHRRSAYTRERAPNDRATDASGDRAVIAEGWYMDPYGLHEARWFSNGKPTALVRDGEIESQDLPPNSPPPGPLEPIPESAPADGVDLLRADSAEAPSMDLEAEADVAFDAFGEASGGD